MIVLFPIPTDEIPFLEDFCVECGNPVKDSGPSRCNKCAQGPFCIPHLDAHLIAREAAGDCRARC